MSEQASTAVKLSPRFSGPKLFGCESNGGEAS
jgi:hypothetical protein